LSSRAGLQTDKEIADPSIEAPRRNPARSYDAVAVSGSAHTASPSKELADRGITLDTVSAVPSPEFSAVEEDSNVFKTVTYRQKTITGFPAVFTVTHRRHPLIGVQDSASLPIVTKKQRFRALFVSRFIPEIIADNFEKSLKE
jgi:hypothetical protein